MAPVHVVLACDPAADQRLTQALARNGIEVTRVTERLLASMESPPRPRFQNVDPAAWRNLPFLPELLSAIESEMEGPDETL